MEALQKRSLASGLRAPVLEVFASIQGEGLHVGRPQVLVRFAGCPLRCRWCDTPGSWDPAPSRRARVQAPPRAGGPRREEGRATPLELASWVSAVDPEGTRAVSVTGGEPLIWTPFLLAWRGLLGDRRLHLETAGAHPRALERVLGVVDHVSLDLKLPADLDAPVPLVAEGAWRESEPVCERDWEEVRRACLALVCGRDACAKIVVAGGREPTRFLPLLDDVEAVAPGTPVVLQPVTPLGSVRAPSAALLAELVELALARGLDVRVLPQVHRSLGLP